MSAGRRSGLALILVAGVLALLAVLAAAFVTMAQLERKASRQRMHATKALLLARAGIEDALARLSAGQDASLPDTAFKGEDWNDNNSLDGLEIPAEVFGPGSLDAETCPARFALRPSFFAKNPAAGGYPTLLQTGNAVRGYTGHLAGDTSLIGNAYALKVEDLNARIHVNGGALDNLDRDPDGPASPPEGAPLTSAGSGSDYKDISMEGPNGFLVRLLDNLETAVTGTASPTLGADIVGQRPLGGYPTLDALKAVLGQARYDQFKNHLALQAWVDPQVVKPQPPDIRPNRFQDIDDAHRIGSAATEISGVRTSGGGNLVLGAAISGNGKAPDPLNPGDAPWRQLFTQGAVSGWSSVRYPVAWERNFLYAFSQLRLAPVALEPRAPVSVNSAAREVLAAVFLGLKGSTLEVWEGSAGWDAGFGFWKDTSLGAGTIEGQYNFPNPPVAQATEDTPWIRTRVDYGKTYGPSAPGRPWYGPGNFNPHAAGSSWGGKSLVQAMPLGRLKETAAISAPQALALADQVRQRILQVGPFRTWTEFNTFVDRLPAWEDLNNDLVLDGAPYTVDTSPGGNYSTYTFPPYQRRIYRREDLNSDGVMNRQVFPALPGAAVWPNPSWTDLGLAPLAAGQVRGLTFQQKDVLKAMANPNTDLNDFNPDANLFKEVDKTDIGGLGSINLSPGIWQGDAQAYVHTTELTLDSMGTYQVTAVGRMQGSQGQLLAERQAGARAQVWTVYRDSTQADFMRGAFTGVQPLSAVFSGPVPPYPQAGGQPLVSYPEPKTLGGPLSAGASYDGQIGLGFIGPVAGPDETLRGSLFDDANAADTLDAADPDLKGPFHQPLVRPFGPDTGNVFPDGVYSERDRTLRYLLTNNLPPQSYPPATWTSSTPINHTRFYFACWVKPNWFPEASPRPHSLANLSHATPALWTPYPSPPFLPGSGWWEQPYGVAANLVQVNDIPTRPAGLFFVPARNNFSTDLMSNTGVYRHNVIDTKGRVWPIHSLLWGTTHSLFATGNLNRRGVQPLTTKPVGRLEAHRWQHVAMTAGAPWHVAWNGTTRSKLMLGKEEEVIVDGGGWNYEWGNQYHAAIGFTHTDGTPNHLRFGEVAGHNNMNYVADATFANVRVGGSYSQVADYLSFFKGSSSPAGLGRYFKESAPTAPRGATYTSSLLPAGALPIRATWTEIPCDLWFDDKKGGGTTDGWMGDPVDGYVHRNDQFGSGPPLNPGPPNGLRDVRIDLQVWDDQNGLLPPTLLATFSDAAGRNVVPRPVGRLFYKAVFMNEWDDPTRLNNPLDVTPFLDDVTFSWLSPGGARVLAWTTHEE